MFIKNNLDTIVIKVLVDNDKWFNKVELYNEILKNNTEEIFIGHYLFIWCKLLYNTKIISVHKTKNNTFIKIFNNNIDPPIEDLNNNLDYSIFNVNINDQINHMVKYSELYIGSNLIELFLLELVNLPKYKTIHDIIIDPSINVNYHDKVKFINLYLENIKIDNSILNYIINKQVTIITKKYNKKIFNIKIRNCLFFSFFVAFNFLYKK